LAYLIYALERYQLKIKIFSQIWIRKKNLVEELVVGCSTVYTFYNLAGAAFPVQLQWKDYRVIQKLRTVCK